MGFRPTKALVPAIVLAVALSACGAPESPGSSNEPPPQAETPSEPVTLNLLDAGGVLNFTKPLLEDCRGQNSQLISSINYQLAPSTETVSKIRAQQAAGQVTIDLVLAGADAIGAGVVQNVWLPLLPAYEKNLSGTSGYTETARQAADVASRQAAVVATEFTGPLLMFNPAKVSDPPSTPAELLEWARDHPKRFTYARPPSSGPGRDFLMGLPYILGDTDPTNPEAGWSKTWDYLAQLDEHVAPYPSSTGESLKGIGQGSYDMIAITAGWDVQARQQNVVPATTQVAAFDKFTWIVSGHYIAIPKGIDAERLGASLALINCVLKPDVQAQMFAAQKKSIPAPAVEGVTLADAPPQVQQEIEKFTRPEYAKLFESAPTASELEAGKLATALERWEREIGS